jgi:hypothetical protein
MPTLTASIANTSGLGDASVRAVLQETDKPIGATIAVEKVMSTVICLFLTSVKETLVNLGLAIAYYF